MKKTELTESQALRLGLTLPYAYITRLSEVTVGRTPDICTTEELLEARFFGPSQEIRIWNDGDGFRAVSLEDEGQDDYLDLTRPIRRSCFGRKLTLRRYLAFDEDGQAYVCDTRLVHWEGDA